MRYLVLSDIHANIEALQAVLDDADEYDATLFLGDLVGYGPNPNECAALVQGLPLLTTLVGNHDLVALGKIELSAFNTHARRSAIWTREHLDRDTRHFLDGSQPSLALDSAFLAHASPSDPVWEYLQYSDQGRLNFERFDGDICLVGHTHVPRVFEQETGGRKERVLVREPIHGENVDLRCGTRWILNPGGVGQPRDGNPRAAYALWDTDTRSFAFRRVGYDYAVTQHKIIEAGLPSTLATRLAKGV